MAASAPASFQTWRRVRQGVRAVPDRSWYEQGPTGARPDTARSAPDPARRTNAARRTHQRRSLRTARKISWKNCKTIWVCQSRQRVAARDMERHAGRAVAQIFEAERQRGCDRLAAVIGADHAEAARVHKGKARGPLRGPKRAGEQRGLPLVFL